MLYELAVEVRKLGGDIAKCLGKASVSTLGML